MTALSINLPEKLAKASQEAARKLGISRTSFIRRAIAHELEALQAQAEQEAMAKSLKVMETSPEYMTELKEIEGDLNAPLPDEKEEWWKK